MSGVVEGRNALRVSAFFAGLKDFGADDGGISGADWRSTAALAPNFFAMDGSWALPY